MSAFGLGLFLGTLFGGAVAIFSMYRAFKKEIDK